MYVLETSDLNDILSDFGISPINENDFEVENYTLLFDDEFQGVEKW